MSRVIFMCGPAGSGKSTYARRLEQDGMTRLSIDAEMLAPAAPGWPSLAWADPRDAAGRGSSHCRRRRPRAVPGLAHAARMSARGGPCAPSGVAAKQCGTRRRAIGAPRARAEAPFWLRASRLASGHAPSQRCRGRVLRPRAGRVWERAVWFAGARAHVPLRFLRASGTRHGY